MTNKFEHLRIKVLEQEYQYVLLKESSREDFFSNHRTSIKNSNQYPIAFFSDQDEFSVIAPTHMDFSSDAKDTKTGWSCLKIIGDMPFGSVQGLIFNISSHLFSKGVGICVVSTFKSDWFFIRSKYQEQAIAVLTEIGWNVEK